MEISKYLQNFFKAYSSNRRRILVGVCGRAGAGKTTLINLISENLNEGAIENRVYSGDWRFNLDSKVRKKWIEEKWKTGLDSYIYAIRQFSWWDFEKISRDIGKLVDGHDVKIEGAYDRNTGEKNSTIEIKAIENGFIFFENAILGDVAMLEKFDKIIVLNTADKVCLERIINKDISRRSIPEIMARSLVTMYSENIFLESLFENFQSKLIACDSFGNFSPFPNIDQVSQIPVPVVDSRSIGLKKGTIFCDLDGTLIKHVSIPSETGAEIQAIDGSVEKLRCLKDNGYYIVLTTSRPQNKIFSVVEKLREMGMDFDQVICDLPLGPRHLINDSKDSEIRALAYPLERDKGIENIDIE